ncbi:MAG TPA: hypothetical protein VFV38_50720 [Ktedonobacteraceae bacterium]|nr:hypothetical protein [Ktedonobacteraceae bacterium]
MKMFHRRRILMGCVSTLLLLVVAGISTITAPRASAQVQAAAHAPAPDQIRAGRYQVTLFVQSGPNAGKRETGFYWIGEDGSVRVQMDVGIGHGTLFTAGVVRGPLLMSFRGPLPVPSPGENGDVTITLIITSIGTRAFTAQGYGVEYEQNVPHIQHLKFNLFSIAVLAS